MVKPHNVGSFAARITLQEMNVIMKHSSIKPALKQTSFLDIPAQPDAARVDPEQSEIVKTAHQHNFPLQVAIASNGREMYAVIDWIEGVAQTDSASRFWTELKKRARKAGVELFASCEQLPYFAKNGRQYQVDYADGETIYRITQHMGVDTGIRNEVLAHLAKTGAFMDAARVDPENAEIAFNAFAVQKAVDAGKDPAWILVRELGKVTRKQLTKIILALSPSANLGIATNITYESTLGTTAKGLNAQLGQKPGANPRDEMSRLALIYVMAAEEASRLRLSQYDEDDILPPEIVYQEIRSVCLAIGLQAHEVAQQLGIDLVSGKKMLGRGS